jgi:protocatechuate 3,4-dioxygenase beta subunit
MQFSHRRASSAAWFSLCPAILFVAVAAPLLRAVADQPATHSAPRPSACTFDLRVVGPGGKPLPDVQVDVLSEPRIGTGQLRRGKFVSEASSAVTLQSDGDGRMAFEGPAGWNRLALYIDAPGYARYWRAWQPYLHSEPIPAELTAKLEVGWTVGGTIVDGNGKPIAGARIWPPVDFAYGTPGAIEWSLDKRPQSDAEGKWHLDGVPLQTDPIRVEIDHSLFMARSVMLKRAEFGISRGQKAHARIVLGAGATLTGRVSNKSGAPVAGAVVQTSSRSWRREAVTDVDGRYRLAGCEPEPLSVTAWAKGFAPVSKLVLLRHQSAPADFQLTKGGKLRLRVLDAHGKPIPHAPIYVPPFTQYEFEGLNKYTDRQGAWEWSQAPADDCYATVIVPERSWQRSEAVHARAEEYVFREPPELVVAGKVTDAETKQPIERFRVVPGRVAGRTYWQWADSFQGTGGNYWIRHQDSLVDLGLRIEADGYLPAVSGRIKKEQGHVTVDFALKQGEDIVGTVLTADGKPAASAKVALVTTDSTLTIDNGDLIDYPHTAQRMTDEAGRFHFPRETGVYWLVATHPSGYAQRKCVPGSDPKKMHLTPWARLEGTFWVAGKPQPSVKISMINRNVVANITEIMWFFSEITDANGRYVFDRVMPGEGTVGNPLELFGGNESVGMISTGTMNVRLESGKTTQFDLGASGRPVIGQLRWPPDAPQTAPWNRVLIGLECHNPQLHNLNPSFTATLDANGNFSIDGVPAGDYRLIANVAGFAGIQLKHDFSVPAINKKLSLRPVDLGVLTLNGGKSR